MNQNQNSSFSEFKDCSESSDVLKTHPQTSKVSTKGEDSGQEKNDARIILADDDLNVRSALKLLLENEAGLDVVGEAENAQDLIRQAEVCCPEIILLDWELPTLRVEEDVQELKDCNPHLRLVAMSGRPESRQSALRSGADAFICKGDSPEHLLSVIKDLGFASPDIKLPPQGDYNHIESA